MKRFVSVLVGACLLALATTSEAAPRGGGGGGGGNRVGGAGYRPAYGGYRGYGGYGGYRGGYGYGRYGYGVGAGVGLGVGLGLGLGYGGWYGPYAYGGAPWSDRGVNYGPTTADVAPSQVVPAGYANPAYATQWGLKIDQVSDGGAAEKAKLRPGDVIVGVGTTRTQTFPELQQALLANSGIVDVTFVNVENKKVEKTHVAIANGKMGVAVTPVDLP
jgi:hypothetical protein